MKWDPSWRLPPLSPGSDFEKKIYKNFLKGLTFSKLQRYAKLLPKQISDNYGIIIFNKLKPAAIASRKKSRNIRSSKLKRKTRRNK